MTCQWFPASAAGDSKNNITAIFLQKALYGLRETVEIVAKTENPIGEEINPEVLAERIAGSVVDDLEDDI